MEWVTNKGREKAPNRRRRLAAVMISPPFKPEKIKALARGGTVLRCL
ncbi:hypothetical protein [Heyndrickxia acidiproducens]|nr:hypothetical protein [Heyndrickxia acidiproducens]